MQKIILTLFTVLSVFATDTLARPFMCRFHSSGKCAERNYFLKELQGGCATDGTKCLRNFCVNNCVNASDVGPTGRQLIAMCKHCFGPRTLHRIPSHQRKKMYRSVLGLSENASHRKLQRAIYSERALEQYRRQRKRGVFGWFRGGETMSENLETLRLEGELKQEYTKAIGRKWRSTKSVKAIEPLVKAAAIELVPEKDPEKEARLSRKALQKWRDAVARKRAKLAEALAAQAGVPETKAEDLAEEVRADTRKSVKPPIPKKSERLRQLSLRLSRQRASTASDIPPGAVPPPPPPPPGGGYTFTTPGTGGATPPPPPPMPAGGINAYLAQQRREGPQPAASRGETDAIPQYDSVRTSRPALHNDSRRGALLADLNTDNPLGRLKKSSGRRRSSVHSDSGNESDGGRGDLLAEIRAGKKLKKSSESRLSTRPRSAVPAKGGPNGLYGAGFIAALEKRRKVMSTSENSESSDSESSDSENEDSEWDD